ncbi:MAG: response regulator [Myxococcales bacterium]|nr:response regulator [Myxococcales bacterium]
MKILLADDDAVARLTLAKLLEHLGHEVLSVSDGAEALAILEGDTPPRLVVLDWVMPGLDGVALCRRIRERTRAPYTYIVMVSAKSRRDDVLEAMAAGADDFVSKPYSLKNMAARIGVGERVLDQSRTSPAEALRTFEAALASETGGEVVARAGDVVGRVHIAAGQIVWAHLSTESGSLQDVVADLVPLSRDEALSVIEEARVSGRSFGEVLVDWQFVEADRLRSCLRAWIAKKLTAILSLDGLSTFFVPATHRQTASAYGFAWSEVSTLPLDAVARPEGAASKRSISGVGIEVPPPDAQVVEAVEQFGKTEGVLSVAAIDRALGRTLYATGAPLDEGLYLALLQAISLAELSEGTVGEDLILTSARRIYLARVVPARSGIALYAVLAGDESNLGRARVLLKQAVASVT